MEAIKILIVEDNVLIAESLAVMVRRNNFQVSAITGSGDEAIQLAMEKLPDIIIMDIKLADNTDGITAAQRIRQHHDAPVIFLSDYANPETVSRAKLATPANYLTKPFQEADLIRALEIALYNTQAKPTVKFRDHLMIRAQNQAYVKIRLDDIACLKADRAYCDILTDTDSYKVANSMNHVLNQLNDPRFIKVHRSYVISLAKVTGLDGNMIRLGKHQVQMSKEHREQVLAQFNFLK